MPKKRSPNFSIEEDELLVESFAKHGRKWSEVKSSFEAAGKRSRTEEELQNRWKNSINK
jgi:hypothetical protein